MPRGKRESAGEYERTKARALEHGLATSEAVRDIGPPPEVADPELRAKLDTDLEAFLKWLSPDVFCWPFSPDQQKSIQQMYSVIGSGGLQAIADPRGTGKTQRAIRAALQAILTGKRNYVCIVAATEKKARKIIKSIRTIVCYSEQLYRLYPNEIHGFPQLGGTNRRAGGQMSQGVQTAIDMGADQIIFPTVAGSRCSGAIVSSCGITGDVRGQFHTLQDGSVTRPDLILVDDPQTKESAKSDTQTTERLEIIEGDVLGLSGPGTAVACIVLCTVIEPNDLSEQILAIPKWHGRRTKTIYSWPTDMKAWDQYFDDFDEAVRTDQRELINQTYLERRHILDAGCELAWNDKIVDGDLSPIQSAMHKWHEMGPRAFSAEYQNEPPSKTLDTETPTCVRIDTKSINLARGIAPKWATKMTAFVDVHLEALYWMAIAWADDFTGHITDLGIFPEQHRTYITLREVTETLQKKSGSSQPQGAIRWGLDELVQILANKKDQGRLGYPTEDGRVLQISKLGIDQQYQTDTVHEMVLRSPHAAIITPCQGRGIKAGNSPMEQWPKRPDEFIGYHWTKKWGEARRASYHKIDTNFWKTFACERVAAQLGESGCLSIFGDRPEDHRLLKDHCTSETPVKTFRADGDLLWEWHDPVSGHDNHWFDCLSNNFAMASVLGCKLSGASPVTNQETRRRVTIPADRIGRKKFL